MQALFPRSAAGEAFGQTEGFGEAVRAFMQSPGAIMADIGPESLVQMAPAAPLMAAAPNVGLASVIAGVNSFTQDKGSSFLENLDGVDFSDPAAIQSFFTNTANAEAIADAETKASRHALGVGLFDAASLGVASKTLIPRAVSRSLLDTAAKRELANAAVQMPVQGAMGAATGQLMSDGEITSWSNVVAEFVGEHFTAPIEIATVGIAARNAAHTERVRAEQAQAASLEMKKALESSQLNHLDPETQREVVSNVAKKAGLHSVSFDAESFHQAGLDQAFPELQEQAAAAAAEGGRFEVSAEKYVEMLQQSDDATTETLSGLASFEQQPSAIEAAADEETVNARADEVTEEAVKQAADKAFRSELSDVGRAVGQDLRASGITKEEASGLQAIYQSVVAATSRQTGISPSQIWKDFGPRILGEPDITRNESGEIQIRGEVLDSLKESFQQAEAALQSPDGFGPLMPEYSGKPAEGLAKLRQMKTGAVPALFHHKDVGDIGLMWGRPGDPKKDYLDGYGLAHIDTKHPGAADQIERFIKHAWRVPVSPDKKGASEKAILTDGRYYLVLVKRWRKGRKVAEGNWTITAYLKYEQALGRLQNQADTSVFAQDGDLWTSRPAEWQDNMPDGKRDLSKIKC